jgi:hypothetical protein
MSYALLADLMVLAHLAYVAFVVLSQLAICAAAAVALTFWFVPPRWRREKKDR